MRNFGGLFSAASIVGLASLLTLGCSSHGGGGNGNGNGQASTATPASTLNTVPVATTSPSPAPVTVTPTIVPSPAPVCTTASPTDPYLAHALQVINADRAQYGAPPLTLNLCQDACAARHSEDLAACVAGNLANLGSSANGGSGCAHQDFRNGDRCGAIEENQGVQGGVTSQAGVNAAFDSINQMMMAEGVPSNGTTNHCTNLISPAVTSVAIGIVLDSSGYVWVTEDFIQ